MKADPALIRQAYSEAEKLDPDSPELLQCLARWEGEHGDPTKAIDYLHRAQTLGLGTPDSYYFLAKYQFKAGDSQQALRTLDQVLWMDPHHENAIKAKQRIQSQLAGQTATVTTAPL
jgi:cytochrome c-type biogenesis protein CcmH/NrfG